jgi:long-chain acyl-CoA synthetase
VPDKLRGQAVCAYLVLKEGAAAKKPQLRRFLMERLASYKVPKYFFFCEQLPKNGTGKVMKTALRENAIEDLVNRQN